MNEDKRITSREIMEHVGIRSIQTLMRWYQRGLIPEPQIGTHPNGRGKMGYWPDWVMQRCVRIRQLMAAGKELDEIAVMLGSDWEAAAKTARRTYDFATVSARLDFQAAIESLRDLVWGLLDQFLRNLKVPLERSNNMNVKQLKSKTLQRCVDLAREGANPVVVYDGEEFHAVPDFVVGQMLAKSARQGEPWLVLPVYREVHKLFGQLVKLPATRPIMRPSADVVVADGDAKVRRTVVMVAPWDYEMKKRHRRK